jgi:hypothetical protein
VFYGAGTADPTGGADSAGETDSAGRTLVRWAFCKRVDVLEEALSRLARWR